MSGGRRWRERLALALAVLAAVAGCLAVVTAYADNALLDADQFASRSATALDEPAVRDFLGAKIADAVVANEPDLLALQPLIASAGSAAVGGAAFRGAYRTAVRDLHRAVVHGDQDTILLTIADIGTVVRAALARLDPQAAAKVDAQTDVRVIDEDVAARVGDAARAVDDLSALPWLLIALTLLLAGAALVLTADRRRIVLTLGVSMAVAATLAIVGIGVVRGEVLGQIGDADARAAAREVWDAVLGGLRTALLLLALAGAVLAAAAASMLKPVSIEQLLRRVWGVVGTTPEHSVVRAARAVLLLVAGVLVVLSPRVAAELAGLALGVLLVIAGGSELLRMGLPADAASGEVSSREAASRQAAPGEAEPGRAERGLPQRNARRRRLAIAGALVLALLALASRSTVSDTEVDAAPPQRAERCNGHAELCDRTLDSVALAGTHNSMAAAAEPGWLFAAHERGIGDQLRSGVRALLVDTHYGRPAGGRVKTDLGDVSSAERAELVDELGEEGVAAALRIRDRIVGKPEGPRGVYLCHALCEVGATKLSDSLGEVERFLAGNPDEVVVMIVEDDVSPDDFVAEVREAGLERYVHQGPFGPPWPTLRSMIEADRRLVVLAENRAGGAPWLRLAFDSFEDTPFKFTKPTQLTDPAQLEASCVENRGESGASLLLINHWIDTSPAPRPSNADRVNAYEPLLRRVRTCEAQRGKHPNVVAVDFSERGDLFDVVDALNGVGRTTPPDDRG